MHPEKGLWALVEAIDNADASQAQKVTDSLLQTVQNAVDSGEDLIAAFLLAHGRQQRTLPDNHGARIIAIREAGDFGAVELAWVGPMHALLVRKGQAVEILRHKSRTLPTEQGNNAQISLGEPAQHLGSAGQQRPRIERNLVNVQRGDLLLLGSSGVVMNSHAQSIASELKGFGGLDYKISCLQSELGRHIQTPTRWILVQVT